MVFLPKIEGKEPFDEVVVNLAKWVQPLQSLSSGSLTFIELLLASSINL